MEKDFNRWNEQKKYIHRKQSVRFYDERELWWCSLGLNVGKEQDGESHSYIRPILIIKRFNNGTCFIVPLTRHGKDNKYYFNLVSGNTELSFLVLSQARIIDTRRFKTKIGMLPKDVFVRVTLALQTLLFA